MADEVKLAEGYDWKKSVASGLRRTVVTLGAVAVAAVVQALTDPETVQIILGQAKVAAVLVPVIVFAATTYQNYRKNKDR